MRGGWLILALGMLGAACGPGEADLEARARDVLERNGYDDVTLTRPPDVPDGDFDFVGTREGRRCEGSVQLRVSGGTTTSMISEECE